MSLKVLVPMTTEMFTATTSNLKDENKSTTADNDRGALCIYRHISKPLSSIEWGGGAGAGTRETREVRVRDQTQMDL